MTKLSDTQARILGAAAERPKRIALPLPTALRGGAAVKVIGAMIAKGLIKEVEADLRAGEPVWCETGDGHGVMLVATDAGLAAIGIEPERARTAPTEEPKADTTTETESAPKTRTGWRNNRGDHGRHGLAVSHGARRDVRGAEEEARLRGDLGEGRRARAGLHNSLSQRSFQPKEMIVAVQS